MFDDFYCSQWVDDEIKELIENEIVFNEDIDEILYDEDWELFKNEDFPGGDINGKNETI